MKKLKSLGIVLACTGLLLVTAFATTACIGPKTGTAADPDATGVLPSVAEYQKTIKTISFAGESFESIEVDLSMGAFEIKVADVTAPGLSYEEVYKGEDLLYEVRSEIKNKILNIKDYHKPRAVLFAGISDFEPKEIVLTLPKALVLSNVKISLDMGKSKIVDLKAKELDLNLSMGGATLQAVDVDFASLDLDMGSLELVGGQIRGSEINLSMGNLSSDAELRGQHRIDCSMGSADLKLPFSAAQIKYEADIAMGSMYLNGKKTTEYKNSGGNLVSADLRFKMSMGSLKIALND